MVSLSSVKEHKNGRADGFAKYEDSNVRSVVAVVLAVFAGAFAYARLASGATSDAWEQSALLLLPAMLVSVLVVGMVFLPLWSFLVYRTRRIRRTFVTVSGAVLIATCSIFVATGVIDRAGDVQTVGLMLVPGMALIVTFGALMDPSRVRGGQRPDSK